MPASLRRALRRDHVAVEARPFAVAGIRLLPVLGESFVCDRCDLDYAIRRVYRCGRIDRRDWLGCELPEQVGPPGYVVPVREHGVCPGWLRCQPEVIESATAFTGFEAGQLDAVFPDTPNHLLEGALAAQRAFRAHDNAELANRVKANHG